MSRSSYSDDCDNLWGIICWRGAVASAINGARGQAFLKEMLQAMDALPKHELVANELEITHEASPQSSVCAIGAVGIARGIDMSGIDPEDPETIARTFGIAGALAKEIMWKNDEDGRYMESPQFRFIRMRHWIEENIVE